MISDRQFVQLTQEDRHVLSHEEEKEIFDYYKSIKKEGDEKKAINARNRIVLKNQRLIDYWIARMPVKSGIREDCFNEGIVGLTRAIESFDPTMDTKFSTYASFWVRLYILQAIKKDRAIHLPARITNEAMHVYKEIEVYKAECGVNEFPDHKYLAERTGISLKDIDIIMKYFILTPLSLDADTGQGCSGLELLKDQKADTESEAIKNTLTQEVLDAGDSCLTDLELNIVKDRHGMGGENKIVTYKEMEHKYNRSANNLKRIYNQAIQKIKAQCC